MGANLARPGQPYLASREVGLLPRESLIPQQTLAAKTKRLLFWLLGGYLLAAVGIIWIGLDDHISHADLIVVPGNTVAPDGKPSPRLQARLDVALQLFQEHWAPLIFVSGGIGKEGFDEAVVMANYLSQHGVPTTAIIKDSLGIDTASTAQNASEFMRANNLRSAIIATQYFHILRTKLALQRRGVKVVGTVHGRYIELRDVYSTLREVLGLGIMPLTE